MNVLVNEASYSEITLASRVGLCREIYASVQGGWFSDELLKIQLSRVYKVKIRSPFCKNNLSPRTVRGNGHSSRTVCLSRT